MADSLNMVLDCTSSRRIILFLCFTRCACIPIIKLTFGDKLRSVAVNTSFRISIPFWRHTTSQDPDNLHVDPRLPSGHTVKHLRPPPRLFAPASAGLRCVCVCVCGSCQRVGWGIPVYLLIGRSGASMGVFWRSFLMGAWEAWGALASSAADFPGCGALSV